MVAVSPSILTNFESATKKSYALSFSCNWANSKKRDQNCSSLSLSDFPPFLELYQIILNPILPQTKIVFHRLNFKKVNYKSKLFHNLWKLIHSVSNSYPQSGDN